MSVWVGGAGLQLNDCTHVLFARVHLLFLSRTDFYVLFFLGKSILDYRSSWTAVGVHYDATAPSELENLLNSDVNLITEYAEDLERARALMCEHQLSKYNHAPLGTRAHPALRHLIHQPNVS